MIIRASTPGELTRSHMQGCVECRLLTANESAAWSSPFLSTGRGLLEGPVWCQSAAMLRLVGGGGNINGAGNPLLV